MCVFDCNFCYWCVSVAMVIGSINSGNGTPGAGSRKGCFRIIGKSSKSNSMDKEMTRNPKVTHTVI